MNTTTNTNKKSRRMASWSPSAIHQLKSLKNTDLSYTFKLADLPDEIEEIWDLTWSGFKSINLKPPKRLWKLPETQETVQRLDRPTFEINCQDEDESGSGSGSGAEDENSLTDIDLEHLIHDVNILSTRGKIVRMASQLRLEASCNKVLEFEASCSEFLYNPDDDEGSYHPDDDDVLPEDDELQRSILDIDILSTDEKIIREATKLRLGAAKAYCEQEGSYRMRHPDNQSGP